MGLLMDSVTSILSNRRLFFLARTFLAVLFCFAGIDKLAHYDRFMAALFSYRIFPSGTEGYAAAFVAFSEVAIGFGLLTRRWLEPACFAAISLLIAFTVVYIVRHGQNQSVCGCWFSITVARSTTVHALQNMVFAALAAITWLDNIRLGRALRK